jgi:hypothetical protein
MELGYGTFSSFDWPVNSTLFLYPAFLQRCGTCPAKINGFATATERKWAATGRRQSRFALLLLLLRCICMVFGCSAARVEHLNFAVIHLSIGFHLSMSTSI